MELSKRSHPAIPPIRRKIAKRAGYFFTAILSFVGDYTRKQKKKQCKGKSAQQFSF
jgi:hypothetical protein